MIRSHTTMQDFINLDFVPKGTDTTPIVPALINVFNATLVGGGAKSINFQELVADLAEITFEYPFRIPPYSRWSFAPSGCWRGSPSSAIPILPSL